MPKRMRIPRGDPEEAVGVWKGARADLRRTATLSCPECGKRISLSQHDIHPNGLVSPSLRCPLKPCTFHQFISLENWP